VGGANFVVDLTSGAAPWAPPMTTRARPEWHQPVKGSWLGASAYNHLLPEALQGERARS